MSNTRARASVATTLSHLPGPIVKEREIERVRERERANQARQYIYTKRERERERERERWREGGSHYALALARVLHR